VEESYYIGIDIGATLVKLGIVTGDGKLVAKEQIETAEITDPMLLVTVASDTIDSLLLRSLIEKKSVAATGIGAPGWVDYTRGIVHDLTNIPHWKDFPLAERMKAATGLESFVDNDVNVMAVGELFHGAGRGHKNLICLTLGTGVGGAIIIDGKIHRGAHGLAGEAGHMTLNLDGPECACGAKGCLENYVGNRSIVARALELIEEDMGKYETSILGKIAVDGPESMTTKLLAEAAVKGDEIALRVWRETGRRIGTALANLINLLDPECFIIGGGVAKAGAILFDPMQSAMESLAMNQLGHSTPILKAELGEDAGLIGSATFAMLCSEDGAIRPPHN